MLSRNEVTGLFIIAVVLMFSVTAAQAAEEVSQQPVNAEQPVVVTNEGNAPATPVANDSATPGLAQPSLGTTPSVAPSGDVAAAPPLEQAPVEVPKIADVPSIEGSAVGKQVVEINERMALLSAQLAELELKAKIAAKVAEINNIGKKGKSDDKPSSDLAGEPGMGFMNPGSAIAFSSQRTVPSLPRLSTSAKDTMPVIQSIEGVDGRLRAILRVSGQGTKAVRVGQAIAGWTVRDITIDGVTVQKGKIIQDLYFENASRDAGLADSLSVASKSSSPSNLFGAPSPSSMGIEPLTLK